MDTKDLQAHLDRRFDALDHRFERVEAKLDNHLDRLSRAEASVEWLRGNARLVATIILSAAGFFAVAFFNYLGK